MNTSVEFSVNRSNIGQNSAIFSYKITADLWKNMDIPTADIADIWFTRKITNLISQNVTEEVHEVEDTYNQICYTDVRFDKQWYLNDSRKDYVNNSSNKNSNHTYSNLSAAESYKAYMFIQRQEYCRTQKWIRSGTRTRNKLTGKTTFHMGSWSKSGSLTGGTWEYFDTNTYSSDTIYFWTKPNRFSKWTNMSSGQIVSDKIKASDIDELIEIEIAKRCWDQQKKVTVTNSNKPTVSSGDTITANWYKKITEFLGISNLNVTKGTTILISHFTRLRDAVNTNL